MEKIKIFIGADYRGFERKTELIPYLTSCHGFIEVIDKGVSRNNESDYNEPAIAVSKAINETPGSFGILLCGSAHGVCIQANRFKGIRAINAQTQESAKLGRKHDDANVLCLSANSLDLETSKKVIYDFFHTKFGGEERRIRRIKKLDEEGLYD